MTRTITRLALAAAIAFPAALVAQTPTPEGTTITNTATATFTDANGNTYANVTASASVKVGYLVSVDVSSPATGTPASPSTGNSLSFLIENKGNGTDSVTVAMTVGTGVTVTGYKVGATTYASLGLLNTALSGTAIAAAGNITVEVIYTVAPGRGGQTTPVTLTATSRRITTGTGSSDASTTNLTPAVAAAVTVTPDGGTVNRVPSNGTQYTATYTITNNGNASDTYSLVGSSTGSASLAIVSVNGTAGSTGSITLAAGASGTFDVIYTVGNVAAGSTGSLIATATSGNNGSINDPGNWVITVIRAAIAMTKEAYRDNQTTAINATTDRVLPGEYIQYKITVTNNGAAAASNVSVSDPVPSQATYNTTSADAAGWTLAQASGTVTGSLTTLAAGASRYFWIRVQVK